MEKVCCFLQVYLSKGLGGFLLVDLQDGCRKIRDPRKLSGSHEFFLESMDDLVVRIALDLFVKQDGFGPNPIYGFIVAEQDEDILGMSMYYYRYSTWKGKRLYLEDLIVTEKARGSGIGKQLLDRTVEIAKETNCTGVMWQVLDWNTPAIEFYKKYGASLDEEWINCNLNF